MVLQEKRINVGIFFGGKSAEHEVSLQSAKNVYDAIDRSKYNPVLIGIDKQGKWHLADTTHFLLHAEDPLHVNLNASGCEVALIPESHNLLQVKAEPEKNQAAASDGGLPVLDVVFPILHGPFGEDGTVQGLLKLADIPFVGSGVLGSAASMDKDVMKRLFRDAGIPTGKFLTFFSHNAFPSFAQVKSAVGSPVFVKPANMGSSVGISKTDNEAGFQAALEKAFRYDTKVIVEEYIRGREIECAILGNENPAASVPGEIIPTHEFYSYDAKYLDANGAALKIPAELDEETKRRIQEYAVKAFKTLCCDGLARADFFLRENGDIIINEINTIPGFTKISMYPKLWEASGIGYTALISRLLQLALEKHERERNLKITYD